MRNLVFLTSIATLLFGAAAFAADEEHVATAAPIPGKFWEIRFTAQGVEHVRHIHLVTPGFNPVQVKVVADGGIIKTITLSEFAPNERVTGNKKSILTIKLGFERGEAQPRCRGMVQLRRGILADSYGGFRCSEVVSNPNVPPLEAPAQVEAPASAPSDSAPSEAS